MRHLPPHFQIAFTPLAYPAAVVTVPSARFTILTERLLRLEYSPDDTFVDQPSQVFWHRQQPVPTFDVSHSEDSLIITTAYLTLQYIKGKPFAVDTLTITLKERDTVWHYGDKPSENLLGTYRTLDQISGSTPLEPGLLSRAGWVVVDDSHSLVFSQDGWLEQRQAHAEALDLYFFGYGQAYHACLQDFNKVAGHTPLLPRWALGNWWSRYWAYTQQELMRLMRDFRDYQVPLSVCIVDMDWHITDVPDEEATWPWRTSGWTGYTWNHALFPDPTSFLRWLHEQGLKTALNLHPADGIWPHEAAYAAMARRMGIDSLTREPVQFDIADPEFTQAYLEELHHPLEAEGVDFWWMDWQQGEMTQLPGLDPLWWLNHIHFYDLARAGKRPFIFSRWGGLGNHRYPIGFSGDTHVTWESLAFQPYFTATAANVGYGWWSHDIGGHMMGTEDAELYTRWVQFGVFSPIMRLHSTKNPFHERCPWGYDAEIFRITREAMQLRHALIPYLYTMSWLNQQESLPLVRPLYHDYPNDEAAYYCPQQYTFGTELIAAPFTSPIDAETRLSRQVVWLPRGDWYHFFSGEYFPGDSWYALHGQLADVPVFAKAGAIVPLGPKVGWGGVANPTQLDIHVFAGDDNRFVLYEDDGETQAYMQGAYGLTVFTQTWRETEMEVTVAVDAEHKVTIPEMRQYHFRLHGVISPDRVVLQIGGRLAENWAFTYDEVTETAHVTAVDVPQHAAIHLTLSTNQTTLLSRRDRSDETVTTLLRAFKLDSMTKGVLYTRRAELRENPALLSQYDLTLTNSQAQALLEVTQQAGIHHIPHTRYSDLLLLWNNRGAETVHYHFVQSDEHTWDLAQRYHQESGVMPRFQAIVPQNRWRVTAVYANRLTTSYQSAGA